MLLNVSYEASFTLVKSRKQDICGFFSGVRASVHHRAMNPYTVLGIAPTATPEEIRRAYRQRIRVAHPDCGGSSEIAARINGAREAAIARKGWVSGASESKPKNSEVCYRPESTSAVSQSRSAVSRGHGLGHWANPPSSASLTASQVVVGFVAGYLLLLGFAVIGWMLFAVAPLLLR